MGEAPSGADVSEKYVRNGERGRGYQLTKDPNLSVETEPNVK